LEVKVLWIIEKQVFLEAMTALQLANVFHWLVMQFKTSEKGFLPQTVYESSSFLPAFSASSVTWKAMQLERWFIL